MYLNIKEHRKNKKILEKAPESAPDDLFTFQVMTSYHESKRGNKLLKCWVRHYTTHRHNDVEIGS